MTAPTPLTARATRRFKAPAERVFDAWLDPSTAAKFLFATPTGQMVRVEIDARVGGQFVVIERRNGVDAPHIGTYHELGRPRRLVFTSAAEVNAKNGARVTVEIAPLESGCEVTVSQELLPEWAAFLGRAEQAWTMMLANLAEVVGG